MSTDDLDSKTAPLIEHLAELRQRLIYSVSAFIVGMGEDLEECSNNPLTGWYRDGCCNTDENDHGVHTVCAKVTTEFLEWLKVAGNDLITPHPEFGFPGLKDGDGWCVCASWYAKAVEAGKGCPVFLKRTHKNTLKHVPIETLKKFAIDLS